MMKIGLDVPIYPVKGQCWTAYPFEDESKGRHLRTVIYVKEGHAFWKKHSVRDDANKVPEFCTEDHLGGSTLFSLSFLAGKLWAKTN